MMVRYESHSDVILAALPHVNAPVADLPAWKVPGGLHFIADLMHPYGYVLHDQLAHSSVEKISRNSPYFFAKKTCSIGL
jgi:hypothetical protein